MLFVVLCFCWCAVQPDLLNDTEQFEGFDAEVSWTIAAGIVRAAQSSGQAYGVVI